MGFYRKKPVVIEAVHFDGTIESAEQIRTWASNDDVKWRLGGDGYTIVITTREGVMIGSANDWIIKGIKGEFYPCKEDIFEATYEAVEG